MKTKLSIFVAIFLAAVLSQPSAALSWGWAVHAYIDDQYQTKWQLRNVNQVYGGLVPDVFNFRYDAPAYREYLFYQTHNDFIKVWDAAQSIPGKALAFGFVSHNEVWGADFTAHRSGIIFGQKGTIPGYPDEGGYVIAKAYMLKIILEQIPQFNALHLPEPVTLEVAHELVERGVDILMKQIDPMIGAKMAAGALPPNPNFPLLIEKAYAGKFAAHFEINDADALKFFKSSERQFRQMLVFYGQALMQDDATVILLNVEQLEDIAKSFLAAYGLPPLPENIDIKPLLQFGIYQAMVICADDFASEVFATSNFVNQQLTAHGISH